MTSWEKTRKLKISILMLNLSQNCTSRCMAVQWLWLHFHFRGHRFKCLSGDQDPAWCISKAKKTKKIIKKKNYLITNRKSKIAQMSTRWLVGNNSRHSHIMEYYEACKGISLHINMECQLKYTGKISKRNVNRGMYSYALSCR